MEKMRWFIIGNLIGFGVLIVGIGINESIKQKASEQSSDKPSQAADQSTRSQPAQSTSAPQQASASTGVATAQTAPADAPENAANSPKDTTDAKVTTDAKNPTDAKDAKDAAQNSPDGTSSASGTANNAKTEARLVTTRDINKGTILHAGDIELRPVDGKLARKVGLTKFDTALGFKTRIDLIEGEMLEPSDLETRETE